MSDLQGTPEEQAAVDTVLGILQVLAAHIVRPDGVCDCGMTVNAGKERGLERAASLNRHRAVALWAAGYRRAADPAVRGHGIG